MQTDTSLCRLLISLCSTRSSSSVTAVTSHLNHPALLSLPALIDAAIFLLSKEPPAGRCSAGTLGRGRLGPRGSEVAPNPWGTSDLRRDPQNPAPWH